MTEKLDLVRNRRRRLAPVFEHAVSIATTPDDDLETQHTKRLITGALWLSLLTPWAVVIQMMVADAPLAAWAVTASSLFSLVVLAAMWIRPSSYPGVFHIVIGGNLAVAVAMTLIFGGFLESGANFIWAIALTIGGLAVFADWRATAWLGVAVLGLIGSSLATRWVEPLYEHPNSEMGAVITLLLVLVFAYFVLWYYVKQRAALLELSDGLLRNILPDEIADRLKSSNETIADDYESTSILFADVAGFTPMSQNMTPHELVALLDELFSDFDAMVDNHGLEKIKTIGDAYMVASGIPRPRADHAQALCDLALEMKSHIENRTYGGRSIEVRIGISSGPVVAGVIGAKKFSYDLWGDSVNAASRMESFGQSGKIQISGTTRDLVKDSFVLEAGGLVDVKGKGPMPVWFVEARNRMARADLS